MRMGLAMPVGRICFCACGFEGWVRGWRMAMILIVDDEQGCSFFFAYLN